jgi:hypothetical protein
MVAVSPASTSQRTWMRAELDPVGVWIASMRQVQVEIESTQKLFRHQKEQPVSEQ